MCCALAAGVGAAIVAAAAVVIAAAAIAVAPTAASAAGEENNQDNDDPEATIVSAHIFEPFLRTRQYFHHLVAYAVRWSMYATAIFCIAFDDAHPVDSVLPELHLHHIMLFF